MALVHRVNTNFSSLLSTFYSKCTVNITRYKTEQTSKNHAKPEDNMKRTEFESFDQMIAFRQAQAKRSVLVKIPSTDHVNELRRFCERFTNIRHIFPYSTVTDSHFVLMELESNGQVEILRNKATYKYREDCVRLVSPLFIFLVKDVPQANKKSLPESTNLSLKSPSLNTIRNELRNKSSVSDQMTSLYSLLKFTDLNVRLRFYTAENIRYYLSRLFYNLSVIPFGSSVNGFGQMGCDLDLLCRVNHPNIIEDLNRKFLYLTPPMYVTDRNDQKEFLEVVGTLLNTCVPGLSGVKKILEARVPIIKFYDSNTNMHCDLSSTNMIALHMSELLYLYGELDWRVKPLVCTIRKWARTMNLTREKPGQWITNFSLTLLVIFYLQTRSILPSLSGIKYYMELHKKQNRSDSGTMWYHKWKESVKCTDNLYNLLYGFYEYYSIFDFKRQAICVREAKLKPKRDSSPLYIYNPFDVSLNVSKNITILELSRLIDQFRNALRVLLESEQENTIIRLITLQDSSEIIRQHSVNVPHRVEQIFDKSDVIKSESTTRQDETNKVGEVLKQSEVIDEEQIMNECDVEETKKTGKSIIK